MRGLNNHTKRKTKKNLYHSTKKGFLLVEALVSMTILIFSMVMSASLMVVGYRSVNYNEHELEAAWLAREGINAVVGLRDSNWLRYGYDKESCWDIISVNTDCATGDAFEGSSASPRSYALSIDPVTGMPLLRDQGTTTLNLTLLTKTSMVPYQVAPDSLFYREILVSRVTDADLGEVIYATSRVQWLEGSRTQEDSSTITLTNYNKEDEL